MLATGQAQFNQGIASAASLCAELGDDVCSVIDTAFGCLAGAFDLGASQLPFFSLPNPFSGGPTGGGWQEGATITGKAGAAYLKSSADPVVSGIGKTLARGFQILGLGSTYLSLANAYSQCAP
jgi:hypothetical protein